MNFNKEMRKKRREIEMSQLELSILVNVSRRTIINIESGKTEPTLSKASAIANALGIKLCDLISACHAES
jgi:DNA-binding XRE family transcriptional regulator